MDIVSTFLHTTSQVATGLTVGTIADGVFPSQVGELRAGDLNGFLMLTAEVTAQLMLTGLVVYAYTKTAQEILPEALQDKTMGGAFFMTVYGSQRGLNAKIVKLSDYTANVFRQFTGRMANGEHTTEMRDIVAQPQSANKIIAQRTRRLYSNPYM